MTDKAVNDAASSAAEWPLRPWLLAGLLGLAGLLIQLVTGGNDQVPWQMAAAAFLFFGAIAAAFTLERDSWKGPALFAFAVGLVMAGLAWRAVRYGENLPDEHYGFAAGVVATALALPLFQAGFLRKRMATSYADLHYHVWTDAISAAGALAFTGLSWLVLVLMSELFHLLKIDFLRDLMDEGWFGWTYSGLAAGAALGTLRNQLKVLGAMQSVVLLVLSLLAVPLALGLFVFLATTAATGPELLWEATRSATPLLLACAAGAFVLTNAIVRHEDAAMSPSIAMRMAAMVLAAAILPLAVFAAVSMGMRLDQHGLSPERLWGLVAVVVACVCGMGFWAALARGRRGGWAAQLRSATFHLALFVCALGAFLALPVLDFGAISARNQVARLERGKVSVEDFDFAALRWDFGDAGRAALARLARHSDETTGTQARLALDSTFRRETVPKALQRQRLEQDAKRLRNLRMDFTDPVLRASVTNEVRGSAHLCEEACIAVDLGAEGKDMHAVALVERFSVRHLTVRVREPDDVPIQPVQPQLIREMTRESTVEVRPFRGRRIYVDGQPLGAPFE
jgi:hypothetical protein